MCLQFACLVECLASQYNPDSTESITFSSSQVMTCQRHLRLGLLFALFPMSQLLHIKKAAELSHVPRFGVSVIMLERSFETQRSTSMKCASWLTVMSRAGMKPSGKAGILKTRRVELVSILLKRDIFALVKLAANLRHVCSNEVLTLEEWGFRRYFIASQSALHQRNRLRSRRNILLRPVYNTCS
jgi:hypothetical protein